MGSMGGAPVCRCDLATAGTNVRDVGGRGKLRRRLHVNPEVFRFMVVRPPQDAAESTSPPLVLNLEQGPSAFDVREIRGHREFPERAKLLEIVRTYVQSPEFSGARRKIDAGLVGYHARLLKLPQSGFAQAARDAFVQVFDTDLASFVAGEPYRTMRRRIGDSIVAAEIDLSVSAQARTFLVAMSAACAVIEALAGGHDFGKPDFTGAAVYLEKAGQLVDQVLPNPGDRLRNLGNRVIVSKCLTRNPGNVG